MFPSHLEAATLSGSEYTVEVPARCEYDMDFPAYTETRTAWACPVALRSRLTSARPLTDAEWMAEMFAGMESMS